MLSFLKEQLNRPWRYEGGGKGDAPATPDYTGAAQATAQGNLEAARATQAGNMINQVTPYGSLSYNPRGLDAYGNTLYTATQTLSPAQQQILNQQNQLSSGLLGTAQQGLDYASGVMSRPGVNMSQLPQVGINPGQTYQDAIMSRLKPQLDANQNAFDAQMANQGITPGSQAYQTALRNFQQGQNDLMSSATINGFNTGLSANQNAFNQAAYNQMQPINVINALRTGSQVQNPNYVQTPQMQQVAGPDILGATNMQYNSQLGAYNAQQARNSNFMGGLMNMGASYMMSPYSMF